MPTRSAATSNARSPWRIDPQDLWRHFMSVKDWMPPDARAAATDRGLAAGRHVFRRGSKTVGLFEVISGRIRLTRVDRSGNELVLHVAGPGEALAEASLFSSHYHCDAIASTDARVRL